MAEAVKRHATEDEGKQGPLNFKVVPRLLIGMPNTGVVRFEWAMQLTQLLYPVNWSQSIMAPQLPIYGPMDYSVAQARNLCVEQALANGFEWLFFLDTDTIPPPDLLVHLNKYIQRGDIPIVAGVYYSKGMPSHPLVFRGRGNGTYLDWNRGDKVWVDGVPMGCTLINTKIFEHLPHTELTDGTGGTGWYDTPRFAANDPETGMFHREVGTEDLHFCDRVMKHDVLRKAGFPKVADKEFPFLIDTNIWCTHINGSGQCYPPIVPKPGVSARAMYEDDELDGD